MIELRIEEYCNDCPDFVPEVEKDIIKDDFTLYRSGPKLKVNTNVYCKRRVCCRCLRESISNRVNSKEEK